MFCVISRDMSGAERVLYERSTLGGAKRQLAWAESRWHQGWLFIERRGRK